jgi:AraC-like DNA-binding protein/quercetin dioxygenase-like cupin family protein
MDRMHVSKLTVSDVTNARGPEYPDTFARSIVGWTIELDFHGATASHKHRKGQLLYVINGLITIDAEQGSWTVPPQCAIWIPGNTSHSARSTGPALIGCLYIDPEKSSGLRVQCGTVFVQPLLRELIMRFISEPDLYPQGDGREDRLVSVFLDELRAAPLEPLHIPMPTDRRLKRLVEVMIGEPSTRLTIEEWGAQVGASIRTLARLFQRETGMSFGRWRQQLHIGLALQRLAGGESVTNIAVELGYESSSAFIAMFRRMTGRTPARYFDDLAAQQKFHGPRDAIVVDFNLPKDGSAH